MIGKPSAFPEWKLERRDNGAVLKRVQGEKIETKGWVTWNDRLQCYRINGSWFAVTEVEDAELAEEILWSWRTLNHHPLCECERCERFRYNDEGES